MSTGGASPTAVGLVSVRSRSGPAARVAAAARASGFSARSHAVRVENMEDWIGRKLRVSYAIPNDTPLDDGPRPALGDALRMRAAAGSRVTAPAHARGAHEPARAVAATRSPPRRHRDRQ